MNTTARDARIAAMLRSAADELDPKGRKSPARKAPKVAVAVPPKAKAKKGSQTRETLTRKDWNRTLTAKARLLGKVQGTEVSFYALVMDQWTNAQAAREAGYTPDAFLAAVVDSADV